MSSSKPALPMSLPPHDEAEWEYRQQEREFWDEHHEEFMDRYPDQFVAVLNGEVIAVSSDLLEFVRLIDEQGIDRRTVWFQFFDTNPGRWHP